jgi:hypothetical protein
LSLVGTIWRPKMMAKAQMRSAASCWAERVGESELRSSAKASSLCGMKE